MYVDIEKCWANNLDAKLIESYVALMSNIGLKLKEMNLKVVKASGSATLRIVGKGQEGDIAIIDGLYDCPHTNQG